MLKCSVYLNDFLMLEIEPEKFDVFFFNWSNWPLVVSLNVEIVNSYFNKYFGTWEFKKKSKIGTKYLPLRKMS